MVSFIARRADAKGPRQAPLPETRRHRAVIFRRPTLSFSGAKRPHILCHAFRSATIRRFAVEIRGRPISESDLALIRAAGGEDVSFRPSHRVWLIVIHQDEGRPLQLADLLKHEGRIVSANTGERLVQPHDDVLVYDAALEKFAYATAFDRPTLSEAEAELVQRAIFTGEAEGNAQEMLFISFRGGAQLSRAERGASPIQTIVDRLANQTDLRATSRLCARSLTYFGQLDAALEGIFWGALAEASLSQGNNADEALAFLERALRAFAREKLTTPSRSIVDARRHVRAAALRQLQPELPFAHPETDDTEPENKKPAGASRIGFASRHAVGVPIRIERPHADRRSMTIRERRRVIAHLPADALVAAPLVEKIKNDTLRPSVTVIDRKPVVGEPVRIRAVLDGEFVTALGIAGVYGCPGVAMSTWLEANNASIEEPLVGGNVGRPLLLTVIPEKPGSVDIKVSFVAEGHRLIATKISFRAYRRGI